MPSGRGGFTIRGDADFVRESLAIEAGLARALDEGPDEPLEETMYVDVHSVRERADSVAANEGPEAARQLLLREVRRYKRWARAIDLGLAGNDEEDGASLQEGIRGNLVRLAIRAAIYGLQTGTPLEQLVSEVVAAEAPELGRPGQVVTAKFLAHCYHMQGRPDLALSLLIRSPGGESAAQHLRTVLDMARSAYANGHAGRVAELLALTGWATDATGLERELMRRLVTEQKPSQAELAARVDTRRRAFETGDLATLRELALSDVVWLEENATLWMALSVILKLNGATEQAELAYDVAELVAYEGNTR